MYCDQENVQELLKQTIMFLLSFLITQFVISPLLLHYIQKGGITKMEMQVVHIIVGHLLTMFYT